MKKAFVIGHPISHSVSPVIHGHWLKTHAIEGSYEKIDVSPFELEGFFARLRSGEFVGGNVTLPHKLAAFAACDTLSAGAHAIGAVNTLVVENGQLEGLNTDIAGFLHSLDQNCPDWDAAPGEAVVLGAGGAARAIVKGLIDRGFVRIHIVNRTLANAQTLQSQFGPAATANGFDALPELARRSALLVNATRVGLGGTSLDTDFLASMPQQAIVYDIVYGTGPTRLVRDADAIGLRTVDGIAMVMHQAVEGFHRWFGQRPVVDEALRHAIVQYNSDRAHA